MKKLISLLLAFSLLTLTAYADYDFPTNNLSYVREIPHEGLKYEKFSENGKWGMTKYGEVIIPAVWDELGSDNRPSYPPYQDFSLIAVRDGNSWGAVNEKGRIVIPAMYKEVQIQPRTDDRFEIRVQDFNDKYGFIDYNGKIIVDFKYDYCESVFIDGMCVVGRDFGYTVIDKAGNELMPLAADRLSYYSGTFVAKNESGSYILDKNGNLLFNGDYDEIYPTDAKTAVVIKDKKQGLVNFNGNILLPPIYNYVCFIKEKNVYHASDDSYDYYFDINLNLIKEPSEKMGVHHGGSDNLLWFKKNDKLGIITTDGKEIAPCIYEDIYPVDGYFMVRLNGLAGILNPDGTYHTPPTISLEALYDAEHLGNGYFALKLAPRKLAILNDKGEFITKPVFEEINIINGKIIVSENSKWYEIAFENEQTPVDNSSYTTELYKKEINFLKEKGIIIGDTDGELNLYNTITRAEFLTMLSRAFEWDINEEDALFADIENHWAKNIIMKAHSLGIIKGYPDNTVKPDQTITYEEMLTMALRGMGISDSDITREKSVFALSRYAKLLPSHGTFSSRESVLRNKACLVIYNLINTDITGEDLKNYTPVSEYYLGN
ncbi:MAG: WG repeat-containing protein [Clostridia bacterium]|nr:WG repeat-containing protein [Clostridia bacterium]